MHGKHFDDSFHKINFFSDIFFQEKKNFSQTQDTY